MAGDTVRAGGFIAKKCGMLVSASIGYLRNVGKGFGEAGVRQVVAEARVDLVAVGIRPSGDFL